MGRSRFSPNFWNLSVSAVVTFLVWFFSNSAKTKLCSVVDCLFSGGSCTRFPLEILKNCCGCYSFTNFALELLLVILLPFTISYIVISLIIYGLKIDNRENLWKLGYFGFFGLLGLIGIPTRNYGLFGFFGFFAFFAFFKYKNNNYSS